MIGRVFSPRDCWVWDCWPVDDGERHHLFFLFASKALHDPDARHRRAGIGHAVSDDLVHWERVEDALVHGDAPAFDDVATWTGSVVRHPDGLWHLLYTGLGRIDGRDRQTIGLATSADLLRWDRRGRVSVPDPAWYADTAWRDPWVVREGDSWRMLVTAHARDAPAGERGVVGTAVSEDLAHWTAEPPLSAPGRGFDHLEVMETVELGGRRWLLFGCLAAELSAGRRAAGAIGGIWVAPERGSADGRPGWDLAAAEALTGHDHYVGRVVHDRASGRPMLLAFRNRDARGRFLGGVTDPVPIGVVDGRVRLLAPLGG